MNELSILMVSAVLKIVFTVKVFIPYIKNKKYGIIIYMLREVRSL